MATLKLNKRLANHAGFLKLFSSSLTQDNKEARDLFHETLYRAKANQDKDHVRTNISAWLHTSKDFQVKEIYQAIDQLPGIFKSSFLLYFEGYKYQEIADRLHEPPGTVKSRIQFAKRMLKAQLSKFE